jgi:hypothetical protein
MSSTYSTNLAIELIGTGDQAGNWGSTTNTNLGTLLEQAISGYVTQAVATGTDTTLAMTNGASATARNIFIELTGTGGASTNLVVPSNKKLYFIYNNSTGAVTVKVSGQTGVSVPATAKILLVSNGTDIVTATNYMVSATLPSPTLTGTPVAPTASPGTNTTQIATTAFVTAATGTLGTMSTQNANNVAITGGTVSGLSSLGVSGTATATTFSGAGTSLTGTAASLSIGGNAATATNATNATNATTSTTQSNGNNSTSIATTAYVQNMGLGWGQSWANVTGSRSAGTTYTNSTGKPIVVVIGIGDDNQSAYIYVNGVATAKFGYQISATTVVPNGSTYYIDGGVTFGLWSELS